jgi:uncharacterized protein (TIGR02466 family)
MTEIETLFVTKIYRANPAEADVPAVARACRAIAAADKAGRAWSKANAYKGYTSYASLGDLPERSPEFADLKRVVDRHVGAFADTVALDLGRKRLRLDNLWINILAPGGVHTGHIHPHSVVSGTFYVEVPAGASAIRFEDPRLGLMMAAPLRRPDADRGLRSFVPFAPRAGELLLWESWLRHEVPINEADKDRVSVSFNYRWG